MKKAIFSLLVAAAAAAHGVFVDGIAAKVNGDVITVGDVMLELRRSPYRAELAATGGSKEAFREAYRKTLENLIDRKLILKAAAQKKMDMQAWVVDNREREIVNDFFDGDRNNLLEALGEMHQTYAEWRATIREDLMVAAMRWQMVDRNVSPKPSEIRAEYDNNRSAYTLPGKTTVSVILLKPWDGEGDDPRPAEIIAELDEGAPFADLAKLYSSDSHASEGGVWKDVDPQEVFRPEIVEALAKLGEGEHSPVIDLDGWGFIVRKDSEVGTNVRSFEEAYNDVVAAVRKNLSEKAYAEWIRRLRADAFIKVGEFPDER